jgi:asparagine synthase (glutamine-hydrolysing)
MCGILVRFGLHEPPLIRAMQSLGRRGPDHVGTWTNGQGLEFGHALLSVVGAEQDGIQPKVSSRFVLAFNGLIDNHLDLRKRLPAGACESPNNSDSSTLLALWDHSGESVLPQLSGYFAFAVFDRRRRIITMVRDQFGTKPIYYWTNGRQFCAASTLDALLGTLNHRPGLNFDALAQYARYQLPLDENTFLDGVRRVMPGHLVRFHLDDGQLEHLCWEDIFSTNGPGLDRGSTLENPRWIEETSTLLTSSVKRATMGRRPWTSLVSGGLDSTIVTRIARPKEAYHCEYVDESCNEAGYARAAIHGMDTELTAIRAEDRFDLVERLRGILEDFDDPGVGSVILPLDEVMGRIAPHYPVVLTGTGGDELFGGYARYRLAMRLQADIAYEPLRFRMNGYEHASERFEIAHRKGECAWFEFDTRSARRAFDNAYSRFRPDNASAEADIEAMLRFDRTYFLPALLNIEDRLCGRHGVESRPALLRQELARRIMLAPVAGTLNERRQKPLLQTLAASHLPDTIAQRQDKMGFTTPIGSFVRDSMNTIRAQLGDSPFRHLYRLPSGPLPVPGKYSREVFGLLMMDLWLNRYAT